MTERRRPLWFGDDWSWSKDPNTVRSLDKNSSNDTVCFGPGTTRSNDSYEDTRRPKRSRNTKDNDDPVLVEKVPPPPNSQPTMEPGISPTVTAISTHRERTHQKKQSQSSSTSATNKRRTISRHMNHRTFVIHMDPNNLTNHGPPRRLEDSIHILYELQLTFAEDEVIPPSMRNIVHLSTEGRGGVQTYDLVEKDTQDVVEEVRTVNSSSFRTY